MHCTLNTKAPSQPNVSSHILRHTCQYSHLHQRKYSTYLERKQQKDKSFLLADAESYSLERERPQAQQNAPKLFKAWSGSNRRSLPCSHSWEGDPCQPCTVLIHFWLLMALSARAGSCKVQKLLPAPQRDPASTAGLQDPGQSRTSQPQPRQHRQGSGACSAQRPQQHLLPLDILHTAPPWDHLCQGKGFSKPVLQDFFSGAGFGCSSQTAGVQPALSCWQHIPCRAV